MVWCSKLNLATEFLVHILCWKIKTNDIFYVKNHQILKKLLSSIPLEFRDGHYRFSECFMYDLNYSNVLEAMDHKAYTHELVPVVPCKHGWEYDKTLYQNTVVDEWNLVCEKDLYPTISLVALAASGLIGNFVFGYVMDSIGRKPAFFIYLSIMCLFGTITAFANNYIVWTIFRIGVGFTVPAILSTPWVLCKYKSLKYKTAVNVFTFSNRIGRSTSQNRLHSSIQPSILISTSNAGNNRLADKRLENFSHSYDSTFHPTLRALVDLARKS